MNKRQCLKVIVLIILTEVLGYYSVQSRNIHESDESEYSSLDLEKLFKILSRSKETYRSYDKTQRKSNTDEENDHLNKVLSQAEIINQWLRQEGVVSVNKENTVKDDLASIIERELLNALSKKTSSLLDRPYLQKAGRNDFLVMKSESNDPFVTVIPNDIYYNVEKKCVNWLTDCNQRGLRNRLLQKVNSPY